MKADPYTPLEAFHLPQQLIVPLFQRPYVWAEEEQWAPLWKDVRRTADLRLKDPSSNASHFLGAVVLQASEGQHGRLQASNVIDGQQRITTLQLVMDAVGLVLETAGRDALADQLEALTHNQATFTASGESRLKLRHSNRDRLAFDEVMNAAPPVDYSSLKYSKSLITRAHEFFALAAREWLGDNNSADYDARADTLVYVLTYGLNIIIINLTVSENSQEIFETLNARGTPLTATDLIKNFVFQRLDLEKIDTARAYTEDWPFDTTFWETEISVGRYNVSRSAVFLNQWLTAITGEEVSPNSTFVRFKSFVEHETDQAMGDLLPRIKEQAEQYETWTVNAGDADRQLTRSEMAFYRMQAGGVELLKPLIIWLHTPGRGLPEEEIDNLIEAAESWMVRRQLLRLTSSDLGRIVADVVRIYRDTPASELSQRVREHLSRLDVSSTYWPGDEEVRRELVGSAAYRRFSRGRLRMLLEATENRMRGGTNQPQVPRRGYPIEHVLPQKWETHWPVDGLEAEQRRAAHVHRLGNLTLLTKSLNSKVSNGPWIEKRGAFSEHDTLLLNSRLLAATSEEGWDEDQIETRTGSLIEALLDIWPVPNGHTGQVIDPQQRESAYVDVKDLVAAGLLEPGTVLSGRPGTWQDTKASIREDGLIELDGKTYESPSGAGLALRGHATNGWHFWRLSDGRNLQDVRQAYRGEDAPVAERFDWEPLHTILESLPTGRWTTYGALASVIGTAAQPVGSHITTCPQCVNGHRVLKSDGSVATNFHWSDADDTRYPTEVLRAEGLKIVNGKADPSQELPPDDLADLLL